MQTREYRKIAQSEISDAILTQQILAGDQRAFEVLVRRYSVPLFNRIYRFLGDYDQTYDVLQQVFLRLYTSLPTLNTDRPFKAWLFQVAHNCCVDELRRRSRCTLHFSQLELINQEGKTPSLADIPDPSPLPGEVAERHELEQCLQEAIQTLPPKFRIVVLLRYRDQLSFSEIGRVLRMPEATVKTYFQRAKPLLRATLIGQMRVARTYE